MNSVRRNLVAGYAGSIWTGLMSFVFIPIYVRLMGIEAYGLVGFFVTLQGLFLVLDLGLSTTLNREFARLSALPAPEAQQRTLLRTIETIYWFVAILNGLIVFAFARTITESWIVPEQLSVEVIMKAVMLMGGVLLLQWPLGMYSGGLLGLQKQVTLNVINAAMATLRGVGTALVLWLVAPTLQVFFAWQLVVSAGHTAAVAVTLRRSIGGTRGAGFEPAVLISVWRFAAGVVAIGVAGTALMQVDKLVVSKLMPLSVLGYYTVASAIAMSLYRVISPLFATLFPRFSHLVAVRDVRALAELYHSSCETLSVILLPAAVFLAVFSREVLLLWTRDPLMADETQAIMTILVIATAMQGLTHLPSAVQLAYGWTRLLFIYNVVSVLVLFPTAYLLTQRWGAIGAALGWMAYNAVGLVVLPSLIHRRVLRGEQGRFFLKDIGVPLSAAVIAVGCVRLLTADISGLPPERLLIVLPLAAAVVQIASATAAAGTRTWMRSLIGAVRA
jgi:O-antigen/teichoic acid export membrane protein